MLKHDACYTMLPTRNMVYVWLQDRVLRAAVMMLITRPAKVSVAASSSRDTMAAADVDSKRGLV
jgi:hypothetical protein